MSNSAAVVRVCCHGSCLHEPQHN